MALRGLLSKGPRAVVGAVGFCTRIPVGGTGRSWETFAAWPAAMVLVAYLIGSLTALPLLLSLPSPTAAFLFVGWLYLLTGITHLDGLADLGDAVAAHGTGTDPRAIMQDSAVGVGGVAAVAVAVAGLVTGGAAIQAAPPLVVFLVVLTSELTAKATMVTALALGRPAHEGLGSALSADAGIGTLVVGWLLLTPAAAGWWVGSATVVVPVLIVAGGTLAGLVVLWWARTTLGGVSGDVFGAINELARVTALHTGVIAWTLS